MQRVLFICVHNSARSQMAEAYLNMFGRGEFQVESAGYAPTRINPYVVEAMKEEGVDLSGKRTQKVFDLYKAGKVFDYVITVCEEADEAQCPVFPGMTHRFHVPFQDPARLEGAPEVILASVRVIRNRIRRVVQEFVMTKVFQDLVDWVNDTDAGELGELADLKSK